MTSNVHPLPTRPTSTHPGQPAEHERAVYTVAEVAHLLTLSLGATYAMVRSGDIPARKIGARWVIPKHRFHTWLDELPDATDEEIRATERVLIIEDNDQATPSQHPSRNMPPPRPTG